VIEKNLKLLQMAMKCLKKLGRPCKLCFGDGICIFLATNIEKEKKTKKDKDRKLGRA
jgi:hypothetical protein